MCCPSRSELLTGRYFHNLRNSAFQPSGCMHVNSNVSTPSGDPLTFATALKKAGCESEHHSLTLVGVT